MAKLLLF